MSFGAFAKQAARYREAEVLSASPAQLVVIVYEHLLTNLRRARLQLAPSEVGPRSDSLDRARAALTELLVTLDHQQGGDLAGRLSAIYTFMLGELSVMGVKPSAERLDAIIGLASELHEAFAHVARTTSDAPAAVAAS
ncbi:MAG TPA: flagellar export chaperone FliS [Gemmatimonadaceae bacterium]|nr:flagellar export chaperone FliS [Gemmatimonadaceae bacterium]HPV75324.1 flagellar export chaperone FliS [Gemmatimonadaceae bacterium]